MRSRPLFAIGACLAAAVIVAVVLLGSGEPTHSQPVPVSSLELTTTQRARLSSMKVFFGHQSVGANILQGVEELAAEDGAPRLRVVRSRSPQSMEGPGIVETPIGTNGDPSSKARDFSAAMEQGVGGAGAIAMYKYCYLDFTPSTDVRAVFAEHRAVVERVRAAHPGIAIVHVTAPLTTSESPARALVKRLLGKPGVLAANARRNEFNALVRETYGSREPVFDLGAIESTRPDGSRSYETRGRDTVYTLAAEYTDDGGHLNRLGRRVVATRFLQFLSDL